jgi:hypothetical protein
VNVRCAGAGAIVFLAWGLSACGGEHFVAVDSVERHLKSVVEETSSIPVRASCPDKVRRETGTRFTCSVTAYGRAYPVNGEIIDATTGSHPWEFDEDDLHVGPATQTCKQLEQDGSWVRAAEQLVRAEAVPTHPESRAQLLRSLGQDFKKECQASAPTFVPYPAVASRIASYTTDVPG